MYVDLLKALMGFFFGPKDVFEQEGKPNTLLHVASHLRSLSIVINIELFDAIDLSFTFDLTLADTYPALKAYRAIGLLV